MKEDNYEGEKEEDGGEGGVLLIRQTPIGHKLRRERRKKER